MIQRYHSDYCSRDARTILSAGHPDFIWQMQFSADNHWLLSKGNQGDWKLWDLTLGVEVAELHGTYCLFSANGEHVATSDNNYVTAMWRLNSGKLLYTTEIDYLRRIGRNISYHPSLNFFAAPSVTDQRCITIHDAITGMEFARLTGHRDEITIVRFTPDGHRLISGSADGDIHIWDYRAGHTISVLHGQYKVYSLLLSPDGNLLCSGNHDMNWACSHDRSQLQVWDIQRSQLLSEFNLIDLPYSLTYSQIVFSTDNRTLLLISRTRIDKFDCIDNSLETNTLTHENTESPKDFSPRIQCDPGGHRYAVRYEDTRNNKRGECDTVYLYTLPHTEALVLPGHTSGVHALSFNTSGQMLAVGDAAGSIRIWDTETGTLLTQLGGHLVTNRHLQFSPTASCIGGYFPLLNTVDEPQQKSVKLWHVTPSSPCHTINAPRYPEVMAFSADDHWIALACSNRDLSEARADFSSVHLHDRQTQELRYILPCGDGRPTALAISPDSRMLAVASHINRHRGTRESHATLFLWDISTDPPSLLPLPCQESTDHWVPDVTESLTAGLPALPASLRCGDRGAYYRLTPRQGIMRSLSSDTNGLAFSPDGRQLAISNGYGIQLLTFWPDRPSRADWLAYPVAYDDSGFSTIAFHPQDHVLAVLSSYGLVIQFINLTTLTKMTTLFLEPKRVTAMAYSPDGLTFATGTKDGEIHLWDVGTLNRMHLIQGHLGAVTALHFHPRSHRLASMGLDGRLCVWTTDTGVLFLRGALLDDGSLPCVTTDGNFDATGFSSERISASIQFARGFTVTPATPVLLQRHVAGLFFRLMTD